MTDSRCFMSSQEQITFSFCNAEKPELNIESTRPQALNDNDVSLFLFHRFDIVLMKEGRMKGQAFVGLPSVQSAEKALQETNGYVLYDKPLVVVSFLSDETKTTCEFRLH